MKMKLYLIGFVIAFLSSQAQKEYHFYSDQPEAHRIRTVENEFSFNLSQAKDKLYINLKVALQKRTLTSSKPVTFVVALAAGTEVGKKQIITDSYYSFDGKYYSFKLPIDITGSDSTTIQVSNQNPELIGRTDFTVRFAPDSKIANAVYLYDSNLEPIIANTLLLGQVVVPVSAAQKRVYVRFYDYETQKAYFPTAESLAVKAYKPLVKKMNSEVSFYLEQKGFYEFASDSLFANVKTIAVVDNIFPKINKASELLKPLAYLSDSIEYKNMLATDSPKKALDDFWIGFVGNRLDLTRRVIKVYYQRVYDANEKFNAKTLGWKSDMGMTYILLGKPQTIKDEGTKVIWEYESGTEVVFVKNNWDEYVFDDFKGIKGHFAVAIDHIKQGNID
jgi:GWxTD domain-containing protein